MRTDLPPPPAMPDPAEPDPERAAETVREALRMGADLGVAAATIQDHLAMLPASYAAAVPPRAVVRHARLTAAPLKATEVRSRVSPREDADDVDDLDVVATDRPGLFARVAGVLALHGGSIISAHAYIRGDGVAVDTFAVRRPKGMSAARWWAAVEGDLAEAVAGRLAVGARLSRRAAGRRANRAAPGPVEVDVRPAPSGDATLIEVRAADAVGVLYRIASALAELELDVIAAAVDTVASRAVDVFYVRDATGEPLDDDHAREVVLAVTAALGG